MGYPQQPYGPPHAQPAPYGQPQPLPEQVIWEGASQSLTAAATGGRMAPRYRLTTVYLYFERGMLSTDSQQVPVHMIADIDFRQSLTQKARSVGDVIVHVHRPNGYERVVLESVSDPRGVTQAINHAAHQARLREQQAAHAMRFAMVAPVMPVPHPMPPAAPQPMPPVPPAAPAAEDPVAQLERLGRLVETGVLTREEFEAKKAEILRRL
ncbi:SHOCT domain-containing protein [Microbispora sp. NPDC004025]